MWRWYAALVGSVLCLFLFAYLVKVEGLDEFWFGEFLPMFPGAVLVSCVVGLLYEALVRQRHLREAIDLAQVGCSLNQAGIMEYGTAFRAFDFREFFTNAKAVDISVVYGRTWIESNADHLLSLFRSRGTEVRVFLSDPCNKAHMESLSQKWGSETYSVSKLRQRVQEAKERLVRLHERVREETGGDGAKLSIYYSKSDVPYSFYRADDEMVFVPTKMCRDKEYPVHYLRVKRTDYKGCLLRWVEGDVEKLMEAPGVREVWSSA